MKPDTVYKRALNATLQLLENGEFADGLPSENQLRARIGVSRTTVRKVLQELAARASSSNRAATGFRPPYRRA